MILFLDFDGVLHPEPCYNEADYFCCLPRLARVLADYPGVSIVISSTWRTRSLEQLRAFFPEWLRPRIIGSTPHHRDFANDVDIGRYPREAECREWLRAKQPYSEWIALDDRAYWFSPFNKNLLLCDPEIGFDEDAERRLREKLGAHQ